MAHVRSGEGSRSRPGRAWVALLVVPARLRVGRLGYLAGTGQRRVGHWAATIWRDHRLITVAVGLSLLPRVLATLAFRPALFTSDSFGYLGGGVHLAPGLTHPFGYPLLLRVLEPFHSVTLITATQHLMGIATAVTGYAVLRRWSLPAWGAVLAACPTLFDSRQVELESAILPDAIYALLLMAAVGILITRRQPTVGWYALAGLLLAGAALTRTNGSAAMAAVAAVLAVQRVGWKAIAAAAVAFAMPVLAYVAAFDSIYGSFGLTETDGFFLWSRTMSFANCAVIKPPADLRALCPDRQPGHPSGPTPAWSVSALLNARSPAAYLWAHGAWWRHGKQTGMDAANNARAMRFALSAIRAQPVDYVRTVSSGIMMTFLATDRSLGVRSLHFTAVPYVPSLSPRDVRRLRAYAHTSSDTHPVPPYAYFLYLYQEPVYFPGIAFGLVLLAGLAGVARNLRRRGWQGVRGGPAALPWAVAVTGVVVPVAVHEYHYRYAITVVPLACLAAGLAFVRAPAVRERPASVTAQASGAESALEPGESVPSVPRPRPGSPVPAAVGRSDSPGNAAVRRSG